MSKEGAQARATAARVVDAVIHQGRSLDAALADIASDEAPFVRMLSYGTIRSHFRLRQSLDAFVDKPLRKRDRIIAALIELGFFQLEDTRVPDHAAVSATVEASRLLGRPKLAGLVNAVLRRYRREASAASGIEAEFNHPAWIIEKLQRDWPDNWQQILAANDDRAPMWLRVNRLRQTVDDYAGQLAAAGFAHERHPALPQGLRLLEAVPVAELPGFAEGHVSVQDGGAQLAAAWCLDGLVASDADAPGLRLLDACAAPGGKSAHLLELAGADCALTCIDIDSQRIALVGETLSRLSLDANLITADASNPDAWWDGHSYDAILLDAPCSASGVIRRHPDIKVHRRASDIDALGDTQRGLLENLWPTLKPGGRLLYVTCSVFRQENESVVGHFLRATPDARETNVLQNNNIRAVMRPQTCGYQVLPGTDGMDGFYFACLEKAT